MNKSIKIGSFIVGDDDNIFTEVKIGTMHTKMKKGKKEKGDAYDIHIFLDDGDSIPHFHFIGKGKDKNTKRTIDGCVELIVPSYFSHGSHKSVMNGDAAKSLQEFMKRPNDVNPRLTNWEYSVQTWGKIHYKFNSQFQPDYSKLNDTLYYRVSDKNGIGIYEALKRRSKNNWLKIKDDKKMTWLPSPKVPHYLSTYKSYFTEEGYRNFCKHTYKILMEYIDPKDIVIECYEKTSGKVIYNDKYQIVCTGR